MKSTTLFLAVLALGAALLPSRASAADSFYVTIVGAKQGTFHGDVRDPHSPRIHGLKYDYSLTVPTDPSGLPTGKRQHSPILFEKEWDAATRQLLAALVTNEVLKTVTFEFFDTSPDGDEVPAFRVVLTNAFVIKIHQHVGDSRHDDTLDPRRYEDISLGYQKMEFMDPAGSVIDSPGTELGRAPASRPLRAAARPLRS